MKTTGPLKGFPAASLPSAPAEGLEGTLRGSRVSTPLTENSTVPYVPKPIKTAAPNKSPFDGILATLSQNEASLKERKARAYSASATLYQTRRSNSVPKPRLSTSELPLESTRSSACPLARPSKPLPQFSERVAAGFSVMAGLMDEITSKSSERACGASVGKVLARNFVAGRVQCTSASSVDVCEDALQYKFHHPTGGEIRMVMYYRDMQAVQLNMQKLTFTFRVRRTLRHFGSDYNPEDPMHMLSMHLCSASDASQLHDLLLPRARGLTVL